MSFKRYFTSFQSDFIISIPEISKLLYKARYKLLMAFLIGLVFGFYLSLKAFGISYRAEALVLDSGHINPIWADSVSNTGGGFRSITPSIFFLDPNFIITSRRVLQDPIEEFGLQASWSKKESKLKKTLRPVLNAFSYYRFQKRFCDNELPNFDLDDKISFRDLKYDGLLPLSFSIKFISDETYLLNLETKDISIIEEPKQLGEIVEYLGVKFTLIKNPLYPLGLLEKDTYNIKFNTLERTHKTQMARLGIGRLTTRVDAQGVLCKFSFNNEDRLLSTQILNSIVASYRGYYEKDSEEKIKRQLEYLERREEDTMEKVNQTMLEQQHYYETRLKNPAAFLLLDQEIGFLAGLQEDYHKELMSTDFDLKLLANVNSNREAYLDLDKYLNSEIVLQLSETIRKLKQQRDALDLVLKQTKSYEEKDLEQAFQLHITELNNIQKNLEDSTQILGIIKSNEDALLDLKLFNTQPGFLGQWVREFNEQHSQNSKNAILFRSNFISYLENILRVYRVREKIVQEKLAYQQVPMSSEFLGLDMEIANDLLKDYCSQLDTIQYNLKNHEYLLDQVDNPEFALTSLISNISDPVCQDMISSLRNFLIQLKDYSNFSVKEKERIQQDIENQRLFIKNHLYETKALLKNHESLISDKIHGLQEVRFDLLQQQISIHEDQLDRYVVTKKEKLKQNKEVLLQQLDDLHGTVAHLPQKWLMEQRMKLRMNMNQHILDAITRLTETKNIAHNLEVVETRSIDAATFVAFPRAFSYKPRMILSGVVFMIILMLWELRVFIIKGPLASISNLRLAGHKIISKLSPICKTLKIDSFASTEVDKFREVASYFQLQNIQNASGRVILLCLDNNFDYSTQFASYLKKKELNTLIIYATYPYLGSASPAERGLFDYLNDKKELPKIHKENYFDAIFPGKETSFFIELVQAKTMHQYLEEIRKKYDCILIVFHKAYSSKELLALPSLADDIIFHSKNKVLLKDIKPYREIAQKKKFIFVI